MEITYKKHGNFLLPDLPLPAEEAPNLGKFGHMRLKYLRKHRSGTYVTLPASGKLTHHLNETDREATAMLEQLIKRMAQGVSEQSKANNQMAWVGAINSIRSAAEEIVLKKHIWILEWLSRPQNFVFTVFQPENRKATLLPSRAPALPFSVQSAPF